MVTLPVSVKLARNFGLHQGVRALKRRPIKAGVQLEKGQRSGFHNLRHSLASFLVTKKKTDVKTIQRSMRHAKSSTMLDHYAQTDMDELIAAQQMMLDAIFRPVN